MTEIYDTAIVGSGPGGYVAAIRLAQRGKKVVLIEKDYSGGTCLNRGCIPSKALIASADVLRKAQQAFQYGITIKDISYNYQAMTERKNNIVQSLRRGLEGLIQSNKIKIVQGFGKLISENELLILKENPETIQAKNIILATGSEPSPFPNTPFTNKIINSTDLLSMNSLPKHLIIVGGGVIGCEFASLYNTLGVEITIIEAMPRILHNFSLKVSSFLENSFKKRNIKILTNSFVSNINESSTGVSVKLKDNPVLTSDLLLVSIGRAFNTNDIGLEKVGIALDNKGCIPTDNTMKTNIPNIYAIGDITGKHLLAHEASHQGLVAANNICGEKSTINYEAIPSVIYCYPEIATIGPNEESLSIEDYVIANFPLQALGKALTLSETEGFTQIIAEKKTERIIGATVVGAHASSLIGELSLAIANELTLPCIYETIHAHPTLTEAWLESALLASNQPLHLPPKNA